MRFESRRREMVFFSSEELEQLHRNRRAATADSRGIYLFGNGFIGGHLEKKFSVAGFKIAGYLDNNAGKHTHNNHDRLVLPPEKLAESDPGAFVVLASQYFWCEMRNHCRSIGLENTLSAREAVVRFGLTDDMEEINSTSEALDAMHIWADDFSARLYRDVVRNWAYFDFEFSPVSSNQYFGTDVTTCEDLRCFVDCGAFDVRNINEIARRTGNSFERYVGFEPDPVSFIKIRRQAGADPRISLFNLAVGEKREKLRFNATGGGNAKLNPDGASQVEVVPLDEALKDEKVTMIKMDIEGAEPEALRGAAGVIGEQKPALAICVYHKREHLWEIPLWITNLGRGYRLRLRHHSDGISETVCHAF